jgi:ABC-type multidrug transport system fused ATPase/permease subunit
MPALQSIYHDAANVRFGIRYLENLHALLASDNDEDDTENQQSMGSENGRMDVRENVSLEHVDFFYPGSGEKALDGVSLNIPANSTVGFVGATGAGKTTVVDIILGLLVPTRGRLLVDGENVDSENRRSWQNSLGYVPQHIFLADDSVAANIAFGVAPDEIDMAAVERAGKIAGIHDFVTEHMPDGYATPVGEQGVRLSGGQRQRIGIARALYHDPTVLVLDEATSALDNVTERVVMSAVKRLGHEKTILMIAHRLSTVRDCDRIFLMENGRVIDSGTYEELSRGSEKFRIMALQAD